MGGRLLYRDAGGRDAAVDLLAEGSFLGRGADCAVRTDDALVSRKNCKIWFSGGAWQIEDLGSSNGTYVNEVRIQRQPLHNADVVRCGSLQVRFVEVDDVGTAAGVEVDPALVTSAASKQLVQMSEQLAATLTERDALKAKLDAVLVEVDRARASAEAAERERSELHKMRSEQSALREKVLELTRGKSQLDEELGAQIRVGEQLRKDVASLEQSHGALNNRVVEVADELATRDRQLDRAHEDVQRSKQTLDELRLKLAELERTKDAGWKELNHRSEELDHLRSVIFEQERLLEERRVGLLALEASSLELRAAKEKLLRELLATRSERDEARETASRSRHQIEALQEEHRRLAHLLSSPGSSGEGQGDVQANLALSLREARVELKTLQSETERQKERILRADAERVDLEGKLAKTDVERAQALEERQRSEGKRARAEEARARAEAAKAKLEEEKRTALLARDAAVTLSEQMRQNGERERRRALELDAQLEKLRRPASMIISPGRAGGSAVVSGEIDGATGEHALTDSARVLLLEEELAKLGTELALARAARVAGDQPIEAGSQPNEENGAMLELKRRTAGLYSGINDALSELRTSVLLAKELIAPPSETAVDSEAARALGEALSISVDRTEEAKGLLRSLREVIENQ